MILFLLPPSETKSQVASGAALELQSLFAPELSLKRAELIAGVSAASASADAAAVFKLGIKQAEQLKHNQVITSANTLPALQLYTGVVYDQFKTVAASESALCWAGEHILVHSALFGLIRGSDSIPNYRLSYNTKLANFPSLKQFWQTNLSEVLLHSGAEIVDLRSKGYVGLGQLPAGIPAITVEVVQQQADGQIRALNHFNKKAKGELVDNLLRTKPKLTKLSDIYEWANDSGLSLTKPQNGIALLNSK